MATDRIPLDLELNGEVLSGSVDPESTLAEALRETFGVRGVRIGCGNGDCGACTARIDSRCVKTCLMLAHRGAGSRVETLEGVGSEEAPTPVQNAFVACYGFQCGFCLPGMVFAAHDLLARDPDPTESAIRNAISGNICRCTGYHNIVTAIRTAAAQMATANDEHCNDRTASLTDGGTPT